MEPRALRELPVWPRAGKGEALGTLLSRGSRFKPAVLRAEAPDGSGTVILKDCATVPAWSRPIARWLMRREARMLGRLRGLDGFPQLCARIDVDSYAVSELAGEPLDGKHVEAAPRSIATQLRDRVAAMHARGVFHLDLRQRQNLLVDEDGTLNVVDFGAALAPLGPLRWIFGPLLGSVDQQAALKYLARFAPSELTVEEAHRFLRGLFWRKLWIVSPYYDNGEAAAVRKRLTDDC